MTAGGSRSGRAAARPLLREGQQVGASYVVERFLGAGAYAEVYRVRHRFLGRQAMKVFKRVAGRAALDELLSEARLLSRLGHPNIVRVFEAGTAATSTGERAFLTMEYVGGGTLERFMTGWLRRNRLVPVAATARILHQVSSGLAVAHGEQPPIVHRDITTHNILIGYDGPSGAGDGLRARLADFGLATHTDRRTELASAQGVLAFKPPETLLGFRGDSRAGDVWALGVIGYLLLTGRHPYPKGLAGWMTGSYRRAPPVPPRALNPDVDACLERIVLDALRVGREHRTAHAGALAERFARREEESAGTPDGRRAADEQEAGRHEHP
jgi:serine/threonine-protein kinase